MDREVPDTLPGMGRLAGLIRSVRTPEFAGITFHEVLAKSALNRVPSAAAVPFPWTVNPYRGCSHACVYCFARNTHTYLEWDAGRDFDSQIVVKTNIAQVLGRELAAPRWRREWVAMGTNTDPYQRAEGRYRLMPGIIAALVDHGTPFSILTKGAVLARDLPLLSTVAGQVEVGMGVSLALLDRELHSVLEPGTPTPEARLQLVQRIRAAGLPCTVLLAPILPYLSDDEESLEAVISRLASAGATSISPIVLHLRPGAREWYFDWLARHRPGLLQRYRRLYRRGAMADLDYRRRVSDLVARIKRRNGFLPVPEVSRGGPAVAPGALEPVLF